MNIHYLIANISNALEVPSKIKYNNEIFKYNNDYQDYESVEAQDKFLFEYLFSNFRMKTFMYTKVEIIEEDKMIEKITVREKTLGFPNGEWTARNMDKAFAIKINELIDEINNLKKEK